MVTFWMKIILGIEGVTSSFLHHPPYIVVTVQCPHTRASLTFLSFLSLCVLWYDEALVFEMCIVQLSFVTQYFLPCTSYSLIMYNIDTSYDAVAEPVTT